MGQVVHKKPQDGAEVVLCSGHSDLYGNGRLGVTVATVTENNKHGCYLITCLALMLLIMRKGKEACDSYNLWIRETMVLNAAWMSAVVQVQTTGRW